MQNLKSPAQNLELSSATGSHVQRDQQRCNTRAHEGPIHKDLILTRNSAVNLRADSGCEDLDQLGLTGDRE